MFEFGIRTEYEFHCTTTTTTMYYVMWVAENIILFIL